MFAKAAKIAEERGEGLPSHFDDEPPMSETLFDQARFQGSNQGSSRFMKPSPTVILPQDSIDVAKAKWEAWRQGEVQAGWYKMAGPWF